MPIVRLRRERADFDWAADISGAARAWEAAAIDTIEAAGHQADVEVTRAYPNWLPKQNPPGLRELADAADEAGMKAAEQGDCVMIPTPRSWRAQRADPAHLPKAPMEVCGYTILCGETPVATVLPGGSQQDVDDNMHLIAAAPELLEASRMALVLCKRDIVRDDAGATNKLRAAIAKAEGK